MHVALCKVTRAGMSNNLRAASAMVGAHQLVVPQRTFRAFSLLAVLLIAAVLANAPTAASIAPFEARNPTAADHMHTCHVNGSESSGGHTSNWAVIVSTSRYWFNYRHASDALTFYHTVRRCL